MKAKREFRDRGEVEVAVLDALVDREEGMTVFELRSHVDAGIDDLEAALSALKEDGLVSADTAKDPTVITVADRVRPASPEEGGDADRTLIERVRDRIGL